MGPVILARAGLRFAAKVHGCALSYTVLPDPSASCRYAREGMDGADGVLVGSRHTAESLRAGGRRPGDRTPRPGSARPGVDVELFAPVGGRASARRSR